MNGKYQVTEQTRKTIEFLEPKLLPQQKYITLLEKRQKNGKISLKYRQGIKKIDPNSLYEKINNLVTKSQQSELSYSQKFLLEGYITLYLRNKADQFNKNKKQPEMSMKKQSLVIKLRELADNWQLFQKKYSICQGKWSVQSKEVVNSLQTILRSFEDYKPGKTSIQKTQQVRNNIIKFNQLLFFES